MGWHRRALRGAATTLLAAVLALFASDTAVALAGNRTTQVSGPNPLASCTADAVEGESYTPNAEAEATVATAPGGSKATVVAWRQDFWSTGSSRGILVARTRNGRVWEPTLLPGVGACAGGQGRATNPWLAWAPDGVLYASATETAAAFTSITVSRSTDGGRTWSEPALVGRDPRPGYFNDKQTMTVDPHEPRRLYVVWNRREIAANVHDVMFARSEDGGRTWTTPRSIHRPGTVGLGTIGSQIVVLPDGDLVNVFVENEHPVGGPPYTEDLPEHVRVVRSTDAGSTWSPAITVADAELNQPLLPDNPPYIPVVAPGIVPDIAVDDRSGALYVVWGDATLSESASAIALSTSLDGGSTWSAPRKANLTPDSPVLGAGQAFLPQVDVATDGTIGISYHDFRRNTPEPGAPTDVWLATCRGGSCAESSNGWRERLIAGSFDLEKAPFWFGGPYIGSYIGLTHDRDRFVLAYIQTTADPLNPTDVFTASR